MKSDRYLSKIFYVVIAISLFFVGGIFSYAETAKELEQNIADRTAELQNLEAEAERIKKELSKTGTEKASLNRELAIINGERKSLENNITQTRTKIRLLGSEIEKTENEIDSHNQTLIQRSNLLASLLRKVDQEESLSVLEKMLVNDSITQYFVQRDRYLSLQEPIYKNAEQIRENKQLLFLDKQVLSEKQDKLSTEKEKFDDQKSLVVSQENKKKQVLKETQNKESLYQQNLQKTLATIDALDKEIEDFETKLKFILNKKALPKKGSEILDWPLDYVLITQRFGKTTASGRLYTSGSHSGMDFRASVGTPVYAVYDGVVKGTGNTDVACPNASFGKWVFVEHDIGLSTTSGHLSKIKVKNGDRVKAGDIIGYSGNTGRSTAPHLHLTVYATKGINGEQGVRVTDLPSKACSGKTYTMPLAPTAAYLDPIDYLPHASTSMFKHPSLAH